MIEAAAEDSAAGGAGAEDDIERSTNENDGVGGNVRQLHFQCVKIYQLE